MLCILDGWGLSPIEEANAVALGHTPNFDRIWQNCPHTQLSASGSDVGLQPGVMGNSEVGHLNIGAGRIVWQDSLIIDQAIGDGSFFTNETLLAAMHHARDTGTNLHLMGLVSNGSVHSSETHYFALLEMAAREGLRPEQVLVHVFTDGRDTPPQSAPEFIGRLLGQMVRTGVGAIASVIGRYYAMDRDNRWGRVRDAYECLTEGKGHQAKDALEAVQQAYDRGEKDEFILATAVRDGNGQVRPRIRDNDAVIFFNYRSDRGRQLSQVFLDPEFGSHVTEATEPADEDVSLRQKFSRTVWPQVHFATMTRYSSELPCPIAFEPRPQRDGLGETAAKVGKTQLRMAETEKYPHVTYFFSGGVETPWPGEERIMVPSPKVATYDLQPEMSAPEVIAKVTEAIRSEKFDLIILNFANPDMVGHTGVLEAAIKAVETIDAGLGQVLQAIDDTGGALLVIADHGNCEQMIDYETRQPHTAHTTNPVPCILVGKGLENETLRSGGRLADVAPTLLGLMGVPQPPEITGIDLRRAGVQQLVEVDQDHGDPTLTALKSAGERLVDAQRFYQMAQGGAPELTALGEAVQAQYEVLAAKLPTRDGIGGESGRDGSVGSALLPAEIKAAAVQFERENARQFEKAAAAAPEAARDLLNQLAVGAREREGQLTGAP